MSQFIRYFKATGEIIERLEAKSQPVDNSTQGYLPLPRGDLIDLSRFRVVNGVLTRLKPGRQLATEGEILAEIDRLRSTYQMQYLTRGTSVSLEYEAITREYLDYSGLLPTVLANLSLLNLQKRFPTAMTEVTLTNKTLAQVMATYGVAISNNAKKNRVYGRIAVDAKARVRAAVTLNEKLQQLLKTNWDWSPTF